MLVIQTKDKFLDILWNTAKTGDFLSSDIIAKTNGMPRSTIYHRIGLMEDQGIITIINGQKRHAKYKLNQDLFQQTFGDVLQDG